jgi:hypothetical protein
MRFSLEAGRSVSTVSDDTYSYTPESSSVVDRHLGSSQVILLNDGDWHML